MRRKVTAIGDGGAVTAFTVKLLERDDCDVVVVGASVSDCNAAALATGHEDRARQADGWPDIAGSDVVVVFTVDEQTPVELATRCPNALVLVASEDPAADCEALWPAWRPVRARLFGRAEGALAGPLDQAARAYALLDHVLADRRAAVTATVHCRGERDLQGWCSTEVLLGASGLRGFV